MTKKELIEGLKLWPDNAEIEVSIMDEGEPIWMDIVEVERVGKADNNHCLLYTGRIVME